MNVNENNTFDLVILASGNASRLWPLTLETPKVLLSISGKPGIFHILDKVSYESVGKVIIVCSPENVIRIKQTINHVFDNNRFNFVFAIQEKNNGPADALQAAEPSFSETPVLLWLGDTLAELPDIKDKSFITVAEVDSPERWCMVNSNEESQVLGFDDKKHDSVLTDAIVGQYYFSNGEHLKNALSHGRQLWESSEGEFELSMVLDYFVNQKQLYVQKSSSWVDYGTMENYAKCKHWIPERSFNVITVDNKGMLNKRSENAEIIEEMLWYSSIPPDCKILAPRIMAENLLDNSYNIEYMNYKTLSEYFIFHPVHIQSWKYLAESFIDMMNEYFWGREVHIKDIHKRANLMYYDKTIKRISKYISKIGINTEQPLIVNGLSYGSVGRLVDTLKPLISGLCETAEKYCSVIHGDLVFSNILCSFPKPIFRLIDPRGTFGEIGPYGDYRYELAKLRQCYDGMYDAILHDLYSLEEVGENEFNFNVFVDRSEVASTFDEVLRLKLDIDFDEIELIQILLFFSLVPMHENENRRQAFFIKACMALRHYLDRVR